ncbi:MAG: tRNA threonylcarbamoyladenosine biosynthesis protein TsaB, partial [Vicinamibacteria bacterium]
GRPAVGVSALEATAHRFRYLDDFVVALIEAYRGEIYGAGYQVEKGVLSLVVEPSCSAPEEFLGSLPRAPALIAGTGTVRHRAEIEARFPSAVVPEPSFFLAEEVGRIGGGKLERGEVAPLGSLGALYIRPPEAERNRALDPRSA